MALTINQLGGFALAGAAGALCFVVPPELIPVLAGYGIAIGGGGYVVYKNSPAIQACIADVLTRPEVKALPAPRQTPQKPTQAFDDALLAALLVPALRTSQQPAQTVQTERVRPELTTKVTQPLQMVARETGRAYAHPEPHLAITYHAGLTERWIATHFPDVNRDALIPLSEPLHHMVAALHPLIPADAVRLSVSEHDRTTPRIAVAVWMLNAQFTGRAKDVLPMPSKYSKVTTYGNRPVLITLLADDTAPQTLLENTAMDVHQYVSAPLPLVQSYALPECADTAEASDEIGNDYLSNEQIDFLREYRNRKQTPVMPALPRAYVPEVKQENMDVSITFGTNKHGEWVYVPLKHIIIARSTGGGKSSSLDVLMYQLRMAGIEVRYATPKWVPIVQNTGFDRRPLIAGIPPEHCAIQSDQGHSILRWLIAARKEIDDRYKRMQQEPGWFPEPVVCVLDELKALQDVLGDQKTSNKAKLVDMANSAIRGILTLGREAQVFFATTAQDAQASSLGMSLGTLQNNGIILAHPSLDPQSIKNVIEPAQRAAQRNGQLLDTATTGQYDWYCISGDSLQVVTVHLITKDMLAQLHPTGRANAHPEPLPLDDKDDEHNEDVIVIAPSYETPGLVLTDDVLLKWVYDQQQQGKRASLNAACEHFYGAKNTRSLTLVRDAFTRCGLLEHTRGR